MHGMAIDPIYLAEKIFQTFQAARYLEGAGMPVHSPSLQGHNQTCFKFTFVIKIFCLGNAFEMKFTKLTCFGLNTLRPSHRDSIMGQNPPQDSVNWTTESIPNFKCPAKDSLQLHSTSSVDSHITKEVEFRFCRRDECWNFFADLHLNVRQCLVYLGF